MNIKELSDIELKALAYDQIKQIETAQYNLKIINEQLQKKHEQQNIQDQPE